MDLFKEQMKRTRGELTIIGADIGENLVDPLRMVGRAAKDALEGVKIMANFVFGIVDKGFLAYEKLDELAGTNPFQVFGEGGFLDRQAKEAPAPKFDRIPPTQHELAITTSASPGSTIENVTLKSSGTTLKTGINNVTGS